MEPPDLIRKAAAQAAVEKIEKMLAENQIVN
jgi:hypothetical protein